MEQEIGLEIAIWILFVFQRKCPCEWELCIQVG